MHRVVLLPGLDGTGRLFESFMAAAPEGLRCEAIALPPEPLTYAQLAERLAPTLHLLHDTLLIAESFSGPLALALAARTPVAAVVLCNTFIEPPRAAAWRVLARPFVFALRPPAELLRYLMLDSDVPDALVAHLADAIRSVSPAVLAARIASVLRVNAIADLARCRMPILYLRGTEDRLVPERSVMTISTAGAGLVTVVRLPAPHLLLQAAPRAAWRAIEEFVATVTVD